MTRWALAVVVAVLLGGCGGALYSVRLSGWGAQVELQIDTREADARREANAEAD